jgi:hypothetical protein
MIFTSKQQLMRQAPVVFFATKKNSVDFLQKSLALLRIGH